MTDHRKPLSPPPEVETDEFSVEMIRGWIAERGLCCNLNLGHWHRHSNVDERQAWGVLLADLCRQIATELQDVTQDDPSESLRILVEALLSELGRDGAPQTDEDSEQRDPQAGGDSPAGSDAPQRQ